MRLTVLILILFLPVSVFSWGFYAHKKVNRHAVFSLPPEMIGFFKKNIDYLTEKSVRPDQRRYSDKNEAPRHYIDADVFGDTAFSYLPKYWSDAVEKVGEDTLKKYGTVPWHINYIKHRLTDAFRKENKKEILYLAADLGHYISDAHVPLHTTVNYDGQLTGQDGIHGLWESRLPELFSDDYDLWVGRAEYIEDVQKACWNAVKESHAYVDTVLSLEKELSREFSSDKKYSYEKRGTQVVRGYSAVYSEAYDRELSGMVGERMRKSIKMIADIWFTCWVDAGQPALEEKEVSESTEEFKLDTEHIHRD